MPELNDDPLHLKESIPLKHRLLMGLVERLTSGRGNLGTRERRAFFLAARHFCPALVADAGKYRFIVSTHDDVVGNNIFNYGSFDEVYLQNSFKILKHLGVSDLNQKIFIEIGANIGTTSVTVMKEYGFRKGILFEPEPSNYRMLRCNLIMNGLEEIAEAFPYAISDSESTRILVVNSDNQGDHRIVATNGSIDSPVADPAHEVKVQAVRLYPFLLNQGVSIDEIGFIWIDTQGHEAHVLAGMEDILEKKIPLQLEFWPFGLQQAGGLENLVQIVKKYYTHFVDVRMMSSDKSLPISLRPINEIDRVPMELQARQDAETDLIFWKQS